MITLPTIAGVRALAKRFWPLMAIAAVALLLLLTYCEGKRSQAAIDAKARLEGNVKAQDEKAKADEQSSTRRRTDDRRLDQEATQLKEVQTDAHNPTDARLARHRCIRLQQQARAAGRAAPDCAGPGVPGGTGGAH
jgi:hypothetical protein